MDYMGKINLTMPWKIFLRTRHFKWSGGCIIRKNKSSTLASPTGCSCSFIFCLLSIFDELYDLQKTTARLTEDSWLFLYYLWIISYFKINYNTINLYMFGIFVNILNSAPYLWLFWIYKYNIKWIWLVVGSNPILLKFESSNGSNGLNGSQNLRKNVQMWTLSSNSCTSCPKVQMIQIRVPHQIPY